MNYITNHNQNLGTIVKLIALLCVLIALFPVNTCAQATNIEYEARFPYVECLDFDLQKDYAALMIEAAEAGDIELGKEYERLRNLKKAHLGIEDDLTFEKIYEEKNISVSDLANNLGYTEGEIQYFLAGEKFFSYANFQKLSEILGVSITKLLN